MSSSDAKTISSFSIKGLMCPVFTEFFDQTKEIVTENIGKYAAYLKKNGIDNVLVLGTTGEGTCLSVDERKLLAEAWKTACRANNMLMMLQIGGCHMEGVIELAKHAATIEVDCILCLPDLFFKPKTEEDLVDYIATISAYCPKTPVYYYHIPKMSGVCLNMPRFYGIIERSVSTFRGIKYTDGDMETAVQMMQKNRNILIGSDTILVGALALGFDGAILTSLNLYPELIRNIFDHAMNDRFDKALSDQKILNEHIKSILQTENGEWVECMKKMFNKMYPNIIKTGITRKPLMSCKRND